MKKTKIIATIGPSSKDIEVLRDLILSGVDIARINMKYATKEFTRDIVYKVDKLNEELKTSVSIMIDLKGSLITTGKFSGGSAYLNKGDKIRIYMSDIMGDSTKFSVSYPKLLDEIKVNTTIKLKDGIVELNIIDKEDNYLLCEVVNGGYVEDENIINIVGTNLNIPFLTNKDKEDIKLAHELNVDYLAISFIKSYEDVLMINDLLINLGNDHIGVISKIETEEALEDIDEIIKNSDAIMISRGDLSVEIPVERIPGIQKMIINKCHRAGKVSIIAADLMSIANNMNKPTRAEVSDIANAVLDGVDVVMLTGETTIGKYPVVTMDIMTKIIESSEQDQNYYEFLDKAMRSEKQDITGSVAYSAVDSASRLKCSAIVTPTMSGYSAKKISRFRPSCVVIALCPNKDVVKSLNMYYGIYPIFIEEIKSFDKIMDRSKKEAKKLLNLEEKDKIIITGGYPFNEVKHTNFMKIEEI